jgi:hypothetical protein
MANERTGDHVGAERSFRRGLELEPKNADLHNALGWTLFQEGRSAEAIAEYEKALATDPEDVKANNNIALALTELGARALARHRKRAGGCRLAGEREATRACNRGGSGQRRSESLPSGATRPRVSSSGRSGRGRQRRRSRVATKSTARSTWPHRAVGASSCGLEHQRDRAPPGHRAVLSLQARRSPQHPPRLVGIENRLPLRGPRTSIERDVVRLPGAHRTPGRRFDGTARKGSRRITSSMN